MSHVFSSPLKLIYSSDKMVLPSLINNSNQRQSPRSYLLYYDGHLSLCVNFPICLDFFFKFIQRIFTIWGNKRFIPDRHI